MYLNIRVTKEKDSTKTIHSNTEKKLVHATVKEAIQNRIVPQDNSSIIPGINVNELKHSLDLLKYALDYSEAIVDTVKLPLVVLNKDLKVLTANRAFYDTFKLEVKETENVTIYKLNNNAWDLPKLKVLLEKILLKNTSFDNYEMEIELPHIGSRVLQLNARRTYRQVNNTEAILLAFEDISDRKLLEKQKDDFIAIVSHELKTPLTGILLFSKHLEKHLTQKNDVKGLYYQSKIASQTERLTQLMASFVNVYSIQNGKLLLRKTNFDIKELIYSVVTDFQYTNESHTIIHKELRKIVIYADKERISQVLINLISNALKYSPNSDKIIIDLYENKKEVVISVQDFGSGISREEQKKIFDRFFRVKSETENKISGLGLGLFISAEIVNRHSGKIWVESIHGNGSTFYFSIPLKK